MGALWSACLLSGGGARSRPCLLGLSIGPCHQEDPSPWELPGVSPDHRRGPIPATVIRRYPRTASRLTEDHPGTPAMPGRVRTRSARRRRGASPFTQPTARRLRYRDAGKGWSSRGQRCYRKHHEQRDLDPPLRHILSESYRLATYTPHHDCIPFRAFSTGWNYSEHLLPGTYLRSPVSTWKHVYPTPERAEGALIRRR